MIIFLHIHHKMTHISAGFLSPTSYSRGSNVNKILRQLFQQRSPKNRRSILCWHVVASIGWHFQTSQVKNQSLHNYMDCAYVCVKLSNQRCIKNKMYKSDFLILDNLCLQGKQRQKYMVCFSLDSRNSCFCTWCNQHIHRFTSLP